MHRPYSACRMVDLAPLKLAMPPVSNEVGMFTCGDVSNPGVSGLVSVLRIYASSDMHWTGVVREKNLTALKYPGEMSE